MPTANQKYSTRVHSRRQLDRAREHIEAAEKVLKEVSYRYADALPDMADGLLKGSEMLLMLQALVEDIRTNI